MHVVEAIEFAIEELESLLLAANSGAYEDDEDTKRCEEAVAALKQLVERRDTCPGVKRRENVDPEYHADDPFKIIERIGEAFSLTYWHGGTRREYAVWQATLHIGSLVFNAEGTSVEFAMRECIQKYVLVFPKGHQREDE